MLDELLEDLSLLSSYHSIAREKVPEIKEKLKTQVFKNYLDVVWLIKPETAFEMVFQEFLKALNVRVVPQVKLEDGWIDYEINGTKNPVGIEVKPLFKRSGNRLILQELEKEFRKQKSRFETEGKNQIINYLNRYDYVVFTNGNEVYYFSRRAKYEFEPFKRENFSDFLRDFQRVRNAWELVRRKEDETPKEDLDEKFFADLKRWYEILGTIKWKGDEKRVEEAKILLLNKFIFIQTLEDFALIPFKFLQDTYEDKRNRWIPRGKKKFLEEFFEEINRWFYTYYDTEIFKTNILNFIAPEEDNLERVMDAIEIILGFGKWKPSLGMGLTFYNFRQIDEDIFGKSYEMFLAENRKEGGIYYTPREITSYMAKTLVEALFLEKKKRLLEAIDNLDYEKAEELAEEILRIAVIDPACGSGSFLIKVLREIFRIYEEIDQKTRWAEIPSSLSEPKNIKEQRRRVQAIRRKLGFSSTEREKRRLIALIILRHIYGIDIDERAVEIAKVNLWKEAVKLHPDSFLYTRIEKEDHILPDLELNIINGNSLYTLPVEETVKCIEGSEKLKVEVEKIRSSREEYLENPFTPELLSEAIKSREKLRRFFRRSLRKKYQLRGALGKAVIYPIEFPHIYSKNTEQGFDGIIGNPPWENIKPIKKEFASHYPEIFGEITKFSIEGKEFKKLFEKKLKNEKVKELWEEYQEEIRKFSDYLKENFILRGKGDLSYQKLFMELALRLTRKAFILLVPSNFHTDEVAKELREEILKNWNLKELLSFENRSHRWFKDVDSRFKFDIVFAEKEKPSETFNARFYIRKWEDVDEKFKYPAKLISEVSPRAKTITEFLSPSHIPLIEKIRGDHPLLYELELKLTREFDMTLDNKFFQTTKKKGSLPLFEGKTIYQFNSKFSNPRYYVSEREGRERLVERKLNGEIRSLVKELIDFLGLRGKEAKSFREELLQICRTRFESKKWKLDYEAERFSYRAVASSTNERTLIGVVIPEKVFCGNSLIVLKQIYYEIDYDSQDIIQTTLDEKMEFDFNHYICALFNSFVLDYYIRQRVSANLNMFFVEELPIPIAQEPLRKKIVSLSKKIQKLTEKGNEESKTLRAELESLIATELFDLDREDMEKILATFVYGNVDEELKEMILERI